MVGCLGHVEWTPAGDFCMWPFAVAVESGRYLQMALAVRPGHVQNC